MAALKQVNFRRKMRKEDGGVTEGKTSFQLLNGGRRSTPALPRPAQQRKEPLNLTNLNPVAVN